MTTMTPRQEARWKRLQTVAYSTATRWERSPLRIRASLIRATLTGVHPARRKFRLIVSLLSPRRYA